MRIIIKTVVFICLSAVACGPNKSKLPGKINPEFSGAGIYHPCKEFVFTAKYWFGETLVSDEVVSIYITGNLWEYSSYQAEALLIYKTNHSEGSIEKIRTFGTNPEINERDWVKQSTTGIIEDDNIVFHHPFRDNQYYFTEITPFPEVSYPLYVDKTWSGTLNIGSGWGIWNDISLETFYQVVNQESISINGVIYKDCWKIFSNASCDLGTSYLTMWFHDEFGFVKLNYRTYAGQVLQLELNEIIRY